MYFAPQLSAATVVSLQAAYPCTPGNLHPNRAYAPYVAANQSARCPDAGLIARPREAPRTPTQFEGAARRQEHKRLQRILLLRHGESEANVSVFPPRDAVLTRRGVRQANSWKKQIGDFNAEVALVSPLRRTVQTACLALQQEIVPMELCRPARELWWSGIDNQPGSEAQLLELLATLPRGDEVKGLDVAMHDQPDDPTDEDASIERLRQILAGRPERRILVVCHWGVINALCGESADNCDLFECEWGDGQQLVATVHHSAPLQESEGGCACC